MIEWVVERLLDLIEPVANLSKDRRELRDNALRSISHALNETYLYYRDIETKGKARNMDTEAQLSRYWAAAAVPMRHLDAQLAEVCEYKSQYWVNPETWNPGKVRELGIGLHEVRGRYQALLRFGKRTVAKC